MVMTKSLDGKVAIVTGASRNLGRAFTEMLATDGASIVVHYNNPNKKSEADDTSHVRYTPIRNISDKEKRELYDLLDNNPDIKYRSKIVLLAGEGYTVT
jgi:NAD(P)-dependent dehydrogenase (short-subunit alcohol dehydrogenase family)